MRYMSSNKKIIILSVLVFLCVFAFYKVVNYYRDKDIEIVTNNQEQDNVKLADEYDEEINLGDPVQVACGRDYSGCKPVCDACNSGQTNACSGCSYCRSARDSICVCSGVPNVYLENNKCYKDTCTITVELTFDRKYISNGQSYNAKVSVSKGCGSAKISVQNGTGGVSTVQGGTSKSFSVTAGQCGANTGVTATSTNSSPQVTKTASIGKVRGTWQVNGDTGQCQDGAPHTALSADLAASDEYYTYSSETGCYSVMHSRGCTSFGGVRVATKYGCYGDASKISLATKVSWQKAKSTAYPTLISSVTKKEDCVVNKLDNYCEPTNIPVTPQEKAANVCEDAVKMTTKDGLDCDGKKFFSIICSNDVSATFDNGDDKDLTTTTNKLFVGQGFKFGIMVTTKRQCTATFNATNWKEAYKLVTDKINLINSDLKKASGNEKTQLEKQLALYQQKKTDLIDLVAKYNGYDLTKGYDEATSLSIKYYANKQAKTLGSNFATTVVQKGTGTYYDKKVVDLGVSGITNPSNYTWNNNGNPRIIKLIPPKVYIDEITGEVSSSGIDGGNKIYIDYNTDPGTYKLDITVSGVGGNNKITNNKCEIKVEKEDIIYRPIDVSNPFINNKWTPGSNWINNDFDFRNIIHSDVWTKDGCYSKYLNGVWTKCA